jgi:integrating conjugative element protein (TIGR03757 family)
MYKIIVLSLVSLLLAFTTQAKVVGNKAIYKNVKIEHVDVFTDGEMVKGFKMSRFKLAVGVPVQVYYVDGVRNYEKAVEKKLGVDKLDPKTMNAADVKYKATRYFNSKEFIPLRKTLQSSMKAFQKSLYLGIKKVPAVVFNDKYVIYGEKPLEALKIFTYLSKTGGL